MVGGLTGCSLHGNCHASFLIADQSNVAVCFK